MRFQFDPLASIPPDDPYPIYRKLRDDHPVYWSKERNLYCVSRFDDVMEVLRDHETYSSKAMYEMLMGGGATTQLSWQALRFVGYLALKGRINPLGLRSGRSIVAEDGQSHTDMRSVVNRGFTPARIAAWEARAQEIVDERMGAIELSGEFDLMQSLAIPLPVTLIAEILGVPAGAHEIFKHWSDLIIEMSTGEGRENPFAMRYTRAFADMAALFSKLARQRRARPEEDLISTIVAAQDGQSGLSDLEVVQFVLLLMVAGNETTTNLIGNMALALLENPEQAEILTLNPEKIPQAVDEALRYDSPVQMIFRKTTCKTELGGTSLPSGSQVAVILGSANRDEAYFSSPDEFQVERKPQGSPGFGFGKHFCLGSSLARLEAATAFQALMPHWPDISRVSPDVERIQSFLVRGPERLELRMVGSAGTRRRTA